MAGFELHTSGVRSNYSTSWTSTIALKFTFSAAFCSRAIFDVEGHLTVISHGAL